MSVFDPNRLRSYNESSDLPVVLNFAGQCNRLTGFRCSLHPGDVGHFLSNNLAGTDPAPYCFVYEANGEVEALLLFYALRSSSWAMLVHPARRTAEFEAALVDWAEQHLRDLLTANGSTKEWITTECPEFDTVRRDILVSRGFTARPEPDFFLTTRSLQHEIPVSALPDGFSMRAVSGEEEADAVQVVHAGSFGRNWQPGEYREVMRSHSFDISHELVVVAPEGRFAAFLVYWPDPISKSGLFEPVGCHADFQRKGLTKMLMYEGMRRMVEQGMETAIVIHEAPSENPASTALYRSAGFSPKYGSYDYRKQR